MVENFVVKYKNIFHNSKIQTKNFFKQYKELFLFHSFSLEDLVQETYLSLFLTIKKYEEKNIDELSKICNHAVTWKLTKIYRKINQTYNLNKKQKPKFEQKLVPNINNAKIVEYNDEVENTLYKKESFKFNELFNVLNEKEYDIVYSIIQKTKSAKILAKQYQCSHDWIRDIYLKSLVKIKKYLLIKSKLGI